MHKTDVLLREQGSTVHDSGITSGHCVIAARRVRTIILDDPDVARECCTSVAPVLLDFASHNNIHQVHRSIIHCLIAPLQSTPVRRLVMTKLAEQMASQSTTTAYTTQSEFSPLNDYHFTACAKDELASSGACPAVAVVAVVCWHWPTPMSPLGVSISTRCTPTR